MNNPRFKKLIDKYQHEKLSESEKKLMDQWFEELGNDKVHPIWSEEDRNSLKKKIARRVSQFPIDSKRRNTIRWYWGVAASFALVIGASYFFIKSSGMESSEAKIAVAEKPVVPQLIRASSLNGEVKKVMLADGSIIWLKNSSALTYQDPFNANARKVVLEGEAFFEIAKDPEHPFVVTSGELTTTVLGTSFNINANDDEVEVVVLTGKVSLSSPTVALASDSVVVLPNQKAIYNGAQRVLAKVDINEVESQETVKGTEYSMLFEDTRMDEIVRRIEGKFNVEVALGNSAMKGCRLTADFTDQSLLRTLEIVSAVLSADFEINENEIMINGKGCD